jgi:hypothetical protein
MMHDERCSACAECVTFAPTPTCFLLGASLERTEAASALSERTEQLYFGGL